jgi:hypothetical protein
MIRIKNINYNKWGKHIGDCAIRAIVAAIGMDYEKVCKTYGVAFKRGHGLIRDTGIDLKDIKHKFNEWFDIVEDFNELADFSDEYPDSMDLTAFDIANDIDSFSSGITLDEFMDMYDGHGIFLVALVGNPNAKNRNAKNGGHIVCCKCLPNKEPYTIDTWNSSEMLVDCFMRIKKTLPKDHPNHWKYDKITKKFY